MADHRKYSHPAGCGVISSKHVLFDVIGEDGIRSIGKLITMDEFLKIPKGVGGRVGVIPWFMAHVVGADGERRVTPMVRLCVTNYLYLSDLGGGFKAVTDAHGGLYKELQEEAPAWKDEIMSQLRNPRTFFLVVEQCKGHPSAKRPIPLHVLVFAHVTVKRLGPFQPSSEIRAMMDRTLDQFHQVVDHHPNIGSSGIRIYHLIRQHGAARAAVDALFRGRVQEVEYNEADLVDEKVDVLLANGVTTAPFKELVRNNANFSKNLDKAWSMREAYASKQMSRKRSPPKGSPKDSRKRSPHGSPRGSQKRSPHGSPKGSPKGSPRGSQKRSPKGSPKGSNEKENNWIVLGPKSQTRKGRPSHGKRSI